MCHDVGAMIPMCVTVETHWNTKKIIETNVAGTRTPIYGWESRSQVGSAKVVDERRRSTPPKSPHTFDLRGGFVGNIVAFDEGSDSYWHEGKKA
jgi:hypothetical protein